MARAECGEPPVMPLGFRVVPVAEVVTERQRVVPADEDAPWRLEASWSPRGDLAWLTAPYGPIHVVPAAKIGAWVDHRYTPFEVTVGGASAQDPARQLAALAWEGEVLTFEASCCGTRAAARWRPGQAVLLGPEQRVR